MKDLSNYFENRLQKLGIKRQVEASMVVEEAQKKLNEIFGSDTEKNLKVISFNKGILKIAARTSAWANECQGQVLKLQKPPVEKVVYTTLIGEDF